MTSKFCMLILVFGVTGIALAAEPVRQPYHDPNPETIKLLREDLEKAKREPRAQPKPVQQTGIIDGGIGSPEPKYYSYENKWFGNVNGVDVAVYAGYQSHDPTGNVATYPKFDPQVTHGFVVVTRGDRGKPDFKSNQIYTPTAVGSLRIIAATGNVLTLQSRQGNKFSFNVETEQLTPIGTQ
jgi:hypothetical protein